MKEVAHVVAEVREAGLLGRNGGSELVASAGELEEADCPSPLDGCSELAARKAVLTEVLALRATLPAATAAATADAGSYSFPVQACEAKHEHGLAAPYESASEAPLWLLARRLERPTGMTCVA